MIYIQIQQLLLHLLFCKSIGVASTYYTINGGTQQNGNSVTLSAEGIYTLMYWSIDKAGNVEDQQTDTVKIDKTAPVISFTGNLNAYTVDQNINISCSVVDVLSGLLSTNCNNWDFCINPPKSNAFDITIINYN
jgi:hypothetical protein